MGEPNDAVEEEAETFSQAICRKGFALDFSRSSLEREVDRIIRSWRAYLGDMVTSGRRNQAGLAAYVGETLRRMHNGRWYGEFDAKESGWNFYTSYVLFGEFRYYPDCFIAYRMSNGRQEGGFCDHFARIEPLIVARKHDDSFGPYLVD